MAFFPEIRPLPRNALPRGKGKRRAGAQAQTKIGTVSAKPTKKTPQTGKLAWGAEGCEHEGVCFDPIPARNTLHTDRGIEYNLFRGIRFLSRIAQVRGTFGKIETNR